MIFVPLTGTSLSEIVYDLPQGFYHAPRIELPEMLWETLDRYKPREIISTIRDLGRTLHLNEIVLHKTFVLYDGPGDFQLIERNDLFKYNGFDERMILGWHVDSNIARRLGIVYGSVGDLGGKIYGYHCDHTRQVTAMHSPTRTENDWKQFVEGVDRPDVTSQADNWGCANDDIEEIRLRGRS